jgi:hypothetical protein
MTDLWKKHIPTLREYAKANYNFHERNKWVGVNAFAVTLDPRFKESPPFNAMKK